MKRLTAIILALTLTLTLAACGGNEPPADNSTPTTPPADTSTPEATQTPDPTPEATPDDNSGNTDDLGTAGSDDANFPGYTTLSGNAYIGGTFLTDEGVFDWINFEDLSVAFELGVPFTIVLDFGSGSQTMGNSDNLGIFMMSLATDFAYYPDTLEYYIDEVLVDGESVELNPSKTTAEIPPERVDEPFVYDETGNIVEKFRPIEFPLCGFELVFGDLPIYPRDLKDRAFSKLEITLAIVEQGAPNPFN